MRVSYRTPKIHFLTSRLIFTEVFTTMQTSTSVPLWETATFLCSGTGQDLFWTIDGVNALLYNRAQYCTKIHSNNFLDSKLSVSGSIENNNVSINCRILVHDSLHKSPLVYLTVLGESYYISYTYTWTPKDICKNYLCKGPC